MRAHPVWTICSSCIIPELGQLRIDGGQTLRHPRLCQRLVASGTCQMLGQRKLGVQSVRRVGRPHLCSQTQVVILRRCSRPKEALASCCVHSVKQTRACLLSAFGTPTSSWNGHAVTTAGVPLARKPSEFGIENVMQVLGQAITWVRIVGRCDWFRMGRCGWGSDSVVGIWRFMSHTARSGRWCVETRPTGLWLIGEGAGAAWCCCCGTPSAYRLQGACNPACAARPWALVQRLRRRWCGGRTQSSGRQRWIGRSGMRCGRICGGVCGVRFPGMGTHRICRRHRWSWFCGGRS